VILTILTVTLWTAIPQPYTKLHHRKFAPEIESAVIVDLTNDRARARDGAAIINREGVQHPAFTRASQNVATVAALLDTLPGPSNDGKDNVYHQLKDILDITAVQQAESSLQL
jgi:hypothetical protein